MDITIIDFIYFLFYITICIYTDWRIYTTNEAFYKQNPDVIREVDTFSDRYFYSLGLILAPIFLFIVILVNGIKILKPKRSIFTGQFL